MKENDSMSKTTVAWNSAFYKKPFEGENGTCNTRACKMTASLVSIVWQP